MSAFPQCVPLTFPQVAPVAPQVDDDSEPDVLPLQLTGSLGTLTRKQYRRRLYERHPYCRFCGGKMKYENATLDHLQPQAQGGGDHLWNLILACRRCNEVKANRTVEQWAADILYGAEPVIHQQ